MQRLPGIDSRQSPSSAARICPFEYRYLTEFQSHEPEFDYLKSLEIEEKINKVRWCNPSGGSRMLLSTNDKTIKLWKVRASDADRQVSTHRNGPRLEDWSHKDAIGRKLSVSLMFSLRHTSCPGLFKRPQRDGWHLL